MAGRWWPCCNFAAVPHTARVVEAEPLDSARPAVRRGEFGWADFPSFVMAPMLLLAIASGSSNAGSVEYVSKWPHIAHTVMIAVPLWLTVEFCSRIAAKVLKPWAPVPAVPLMLGALVSTQLNVFFSMFRNWMLAPYLAPGSHHFAIWPWNYGDPTYRLEAALTISQVILFWLVMNAVFVKFFGFTRFGSRSLFRAAPGGPAASGAAPVAFDPAPVARDSAPVALDPAPVARDSAPVARDSAPVARDPAPAVPLPAVAMPASPLLSRLPPTIGRDIIALSAQEHYTEVHTSQGSTLVLMRFADAMTAAAAVTSGTRVHRSYWVARNAVERIEGEGERMILGLSNGMKVPVSRSYRLQIRELLGDAGLTDRA